ncbi:MAG: phage head-tail connector protein [Planctomycetes bacterium]|nr:phage head-tail connector protein [Planctomycetota bacterium]
MANTSWYGQPLHFGLQLVTPPAVEPVTLAEAKDWARVEITDDDALITSLIVAARRYVEAHLKRALITQTWKLTADQFPVLGQQWTLVGPELRLPLPPLQSVTSIVYEASDGTPITLDPSTYIVDTISQPGRITPAYSQSWPAARPVPGSVQIAYVAGYGDASAVPDSIKTAIKLLVAHWYKNREAVGDAGAPVPLAVENLLAAESAGVWT